MKEKETGTQTDESSKVVEDLTLSETDSANVKGGPSDYLLQLDGIKGESSGALHTGYDIKANKKL